MGKKKMDYSELYQQDARFARYVDRYSVTYHADAKTALTHCLVKAVGNMYAFDKRTKRNSYVA